MITSHKWRIAHEGEREVLEQLTYVERPCGYLGTCNRPRDEHARATGKKLARCTCACYDPVAGGKCVLCDHGEDDHVSLIAGRIGPCHRELS